MSEETAAATEPEDDATVVHDEAAEEKAHDDLVSDVAKILEDKPEEEQPDQESDEKEQPAGEKAGEGAEEKPSKDEPEDLSQELQTRAEGAGISKELAQRLHQSGQLEETVAAFDRRMIEHVQSKESPKDDKTKDKERREQEPPPKDPDVPALDPDVYDEDLTKRDAYHQRRLDALEAQVAELIGERESAFDKRFDSVIDELGHEALFGKGASVPTDKQANRDTLFRAYQGVCVAYGADPNDCDPQWAQRALAAMFPKEVFKKAQRQTVDRLRDAEGKFLSRSKSKGAPPPKGASEEEVHDQLVSNVDAYLKEQGVQMSGF